MCPYSPYDYLLVPGADEDFVSWSPEMGRTHIICEPAYGQEQPLHHREATSDIALKVTS